ncbi:tRNA uridine(34) 5-carboxymethylaminomethyl modification radical SAM/GNAT enzyme Elp3 [Candidatus Micrarchaeota archaeon]|nr:tRNA uridine(34) 5-carboxymethylaminomethyl modification radical SAM/GNAT enzyme Elp3 [Candidatus Micrarchaeota archaeon]
MFPLIDARAAALDELVRTLNDEPPASHQELLDLKSAIAKEFGLKAVFKNSEILKAGQDRLNAQAQKILRTRNVRSLSGVSVIALMMHPDWCPHGTCVYCPGGPNTNSPKSYTGFEPAARRAGQNDFDSHRQVTSRLHQLESIGHTPQKCEVILMGGTFNAQPLDYQHGFLKGLYEAFDRKTYATWTEAKEANESAPYRVIGLTFETKPDWATPPHVDQLLEYGGTRVELGIQSLDPAVLEKAHRGHTLQQSWEATAACKDAFLKVGYHIMPGLFSTPEKDVAMFQELFSDAKWRPDMLKIYPCLVMPGTGLYQMWKQGVFTPYTAAIAADVMADAKPFIPEYCRVMRIDRDIPTNLIAAGVEKSNLREMVQQRMAAKGTKCRCIRCREAGLKARDGTNVDWKSATMRRMDYDASKGKEVFLSYADKNDTLLGFLRLRLPHAPWRAEITNDTAGVRELHVYGEVLPLHLRTKDAVQHKQLGKKLLEEAGRIAREDWGCKKLLVISGVGVREYYRKQGFERDGVYMGKRL